MTFSKTISIVLPIVILVEIQSNMYRLYKCTEIILQNGKTEIQTYNIYRIKIIKIFQR